MKFLKKQAAMTTSCTISHYHYPTSAYTDTSLSYRKVLQRFVKLAQLLKQNLIHLKQKLVKEHSVATRDFRIIDWAPLIKSSSLIEISDGTNYGNPADRYYDNPLTGKTILCVGGRIKLYPEYNQIVKKFGGTFISFHGDSNDTLNNLFLLMEKTADMIICPVDCINHEAFQTVKYYCRSSGKPCVLLDRSTINSFRMGIRMLAKMMTKKTGH